MTDVLTKRQRSLNMSRIKSRHTTPELIIRKLLFSKGLRGYRLHRNLRGRPDIIYPVNKLAIFIDGCFWHKCRKCFIKPTTRVKFWENKLSGNVKRDKVISSELEKTGWQVLRIWEHEVKENPEKVLDRISSVLTGKHN